MAIALMAQPAFAITITSFSPTSGNVGTSVTINGTGYSTTLTNDTVKFNGTVATVTSATTIKIIATVPSGATTGRITVTVSGVTATSSTDFTVKPQVTGFTPGSGPVGTPITVRGEGFSPTPVNNVVTLHGTTATVTSASATALAITVPAGATTGTIKVVVGSNSSTSTASFTVTPSITGFSPNNGVFNDPVTITGYNFSTTRTNDAVAFGGVAASVTSATATQLVAGVPYAAVSGPISVTVAGSTATSTQSFSVTLSLIGLMQWYGSEGDQIEIDGTGFDPVIADNAVDFNGVPAVVISASATEIFVEVPAGATTGPVHITSGGQSATTDGDFTIQPKITSFSPESGLVGSTVNINGVDFSAAVTDNIVKFGSAVATILTASPTLLTVAVPSGAGNGPLLVSTSGESALSTDSFTVTPQFLSFTPKSGPAGYSSVTITGEGFDPAPQNNVVTINGAAATVTQAATQQLVVSVPANATTGLIQVTVSGTTLTSAEPFTIAPQITSFTPTSGPVGTSVTLQGYGFSATPSANLVAFGGAAATVTSASATQLTVTVPSGANTGPVQVTVNGGTGQSDLSFVVTASGNTIATDGPSTQANTTVAGQNIVLTFNGTAGQYLGLGISMSTSPTSARPTVAVTGPSGTLAPDTLCVTACTFDLGALPATGTYTVTATPHASATMNLVATLSTDVMTTILTSSPFELALPRPGQIARLGFSANEGDIAILEFTEVVIEPSVEQALMELKNPSGTDFVEPKVLSAAPLVHLSEDGTYVLIIKRSFNASNMRMTIDFAPPGTIEINGAMVEQDSRQFDAAFGNSGLLTFEATAGEQLGVGVALVPPLGYYSDNRLDSSIFVYGPNGDVVYAPDQFILPDGSIVLLGHSCTDSSPNLPGCNGVFEIEQTGTYAIYITPTHFQETLSTTLLGALALNGPAFVYSPRRGQPGHLTFSGSAGQNLQLQWDNTTTLYDQLPVIVTGPEGSGLTWFYAQGGVHSPGVAYLPTLPATGTYAVDVDICCGGIPYWPVALTTQTCPPPYADTGLAPPSRTTITSVTPNPVTLGGSYTVSVDVWTCAGDNPAGIVSVEALIDDNPNYVGTCSFDTTVTTSCVIQATVGGLQQLDALFVPSDNSVVQPSRGEATVTVSQAGASVAIANVVPSTSSANQAYSISVAVVPIPPATATPTGTVVISNGTSNCTVTLPGNSCSLTSTTPGVVPLTASYSGDTGYAAAVSSPVPHIVSGAGGSVPAGSEACGVDPSQLTPPNQFTPIAETPGIVPSAGLTYDIIGSSPTSATIESPSPSSTVQGAAIDVVGTYTGPLNTGITVNGVIGYTTPYGAFLVPSVPLAVGANTLTLKATTLTGATVTSSLVVNRTSDDPTVTVTTAYPSGLAPATIWFDFEVGTLPNGATVQSASVDWNGDDQFDQSASSVDQLSNVIGYDQPGVYRAQFRVIDSNSISYSSYRYIVIGDLTAQRSMVCDVYGYLKARVAAQDPDGAALAFQENVRPKYLTFFDALGANLSSIAPGLGTIVSGQIGRTNAEMLIVHDNSDQTRTGNPLRVTQGADGVWRISEM